MENFWRWFQLFCWCFRLCLKHCSSSCCCCRSWKLTSTRMDVRQQTMHQRPVREKSTCRYSQNRHSFSFLVQQVLMNSRFSQTSPFPFVRVGVLVFSGIWKLIIKFWTNRIRVPLKLISNGSRQVLCVPRLLLILGAINVLCVPSNDDDGSKSPRSNFKKWRCCNVPCRLGVN